MVRGSTRDWGPSDPPACIWMGGGRPSYQPQLRPLTFTSSLGQWTWFS